MSFLELKHSDVHASAYQVFGNYLAKLQAIRFALHMPTSVHGLHVLYRASDRHSRNEISPWLQQRVVPDC